MYIIENWDNPEIWRQHQIGYSLVKKYAVRSKKDTEGNMLRSLHVMRRKGEKAGDKLGRKILRHKELFDAIYDAHCSLRHLKSSACYKERGEASSSQYHNTARECSYQCVSCVAVFMAILKF